MLDNKQEQTFNLLQIYRIVKSLLTNAIHYCLYQCPATDAADQSQQI